MTDRVEEIRELKAAEMDSRQIAMTLRVWAGEYRAAGQRGAGAILAKASSEIQRLRKVEGAARKALSGLEDGRRQKEEAEQGIKGWRCAADAEVFGHLLGPYGFSLLHLRNALEQHIPEPVREEMGR